ncbi:MAG: FAD-dependent oxidoreductase [Firmicutes bacterium]|nr:FAD-dependent oxidoreductase [Bacillota bacterium]
MGSVMDDSTRKEIRNFLSTLPHPVNLKFFTQERECPLCAHQKKLLDELIPLSPKLRLEVFDLVKHRDKASEYGINKIPALVIEGDEDYGIRLFGLTTGYEFQSLLEAITMVSQRDSGLPQELRQLVRSITDPVHLQVMVTATCPYCPKAVHTAHQFAMENPNIRGDMIELSGFPTVSQKYQVQGVPKTIINEDFSVEGAVPPEMLFIEILKSVNPEEYQRLEESIRDSDPNRKVKKADPEHIYETIIVGGGPAALSAAVYAARKNLDVLLVSKSIGGQIYYTASIENYLGFPSIDGREMIERFRAHAEMYPISMYLGELVTEIKHEDSLYLAQMEKGTQFRGKSVIYTAGKEYKRLGVPGENHLIGKGIAFCATCDAPLYKDKTVAVVGGGNSALTAVRDLLSYARQVFLIHRREEFTGDPVLLEQLRNSKKVKIYPGWVVVEFTGTSKLNGLRMVKADNSDMMDLKTDGVFLEIGLTPNTLPVKGLLELNDYGEIPVNCDNSTSLPGFFAAGDVTDVPEKQIVVAAGEGGKAAISVNRYLQEKGLTNSTAALKESWQ